MKTANVVFRPGLYPTIAFLVLLPFLLSMGTWQLNRADEKHQLMQAREGRKDSAAVDLNATVKLTEADRHKPATVTGSYLARPQWLLDNRIFRGRPGYHVFSLLQLTGPGQRTVVVNRGWVALGLNRSFLPSVDVPSGMQQLQGRLDTPASVGLVLEAAPLNDLAPVSVVQHLDLAELASMLGESLPDYALVLDEGQAGLLQRDWRPAGLITPEKHLGYAVQWYAMAFALVLIYIGVNTRRKEEDES